MPDSLWVAQKRQLDSPATLNDGIKRHPSRSHRLLLTSTMPDSLWVAQKRALASPETLNDGRTLHLSCSHRFRFCRPPVAGACAASKSASAMDGIPCSERWSDTRSPYSDGEHSDLLNCPLSISRSNSCQVVQLTATFRHKSGTPSPADVDGCTWVRGRSNVLYICINCFKHNYIIV